MPKVLKYCLIPVFIFHLHQIHAQNYKYLLLEKQGSLKKIRIYPGDHLRFRFRDDNHFYSRQIKDLAGNMIIFDNTVIKTTEIAEIDISNHKERVSPFINLGKKLPVVGVGYFLIDQFNRSVVNNQPWGIDRKVARNGGILAGIGLLFVLTDKKTFKVKGRRQLRIVNLHPYGNNEN